MASDTSAKDRATADSRRSESTSTAIGTDGEILRVLNFSGGGFDTTMQLGVTHALLVNQGKAPDVVVGVSAGAIEAAALAEILRAGKLPADRSALDSELYTEILGKRVGRFRQFADACHGAPESLVDAVVPDAYQIDSFEPLSSLRLPRLSAEERAERDEWIKRKTGLVRLYNDLLSVDLPFGTITRLIRRGLGCSAARALTQRYKRWPIIFIEFVRLWLVAGSELRRLAPLLPILIRPLVGGREHIHLSTAGSIIFKFRPIEAFWNFLTHAGSFVFLLNFWLVVSWAVVLLPFFFAGLANGSADSRFAYFWIFYIFYLIPIILPLTPVALTYDKYKLAPALRDLSKGLFAFLYYLLKWTVVLLAIYSGLILVIAAVFGLLGITLLAEMREDYAILVLWLLIVAVLLALVRPIITLLAANAAFRRARKKYGVSAGQWYIGRFLDSYGLGPALAHNYTLKRLLIRLFNPRYFGKPAMGSVLSQSLQDVTSPGHRYTETSQRRTLSTYLDTENGRLPKIVVAVAAADVGAGKLVVIPQTAPVVDSLLAATAVTPIFSPVRLESKLYADGVTIGNSPTTALVQLIETLGLADVSAVHIYAVDPLPISREELGPYPPVKDQPYINLLDIVMRALQLERFRDAKLERNLTHAISRTLPHGSGTVSIEEDGKKYFRAYYAPIELESPPNLNRKVLTSGRAARRMSIAETIASGCRSALQVMHAGTLKEIAVNPDYHRDAERGFIKCSSLLEEVKAKRSHRTVCNRLPGSGSDGPGLAEICRHCRLVDTDGELLHEDAHQSVRVVKPGGDGESTLPPEVGDWPYELDDDDATVSIEQSADIAPAMSPQARASDERPCISALFSGGVFRGVYQLGVLNALSLLNVRPRVVAGASVGSITAAMVLSALTETDGRARRNKIARLASAYIGIDRFILTDRFSDFIRNWTIRAAEARFSLRQADRVFRKYDVGGLGRFQRDFRQVMAGFERLFYVNPYQVNFVTRSLRNRAGDDAGAQLKHNVQQWLDRMEVGEEVLGAEPIRSLIEEFVIPEIHREVPAMAPFGCIDEETLFLATATNLTRGKLELLASHDAEVNTTLIEGLLASSAFPGVFRPRRSWDLRPGTNETEQFIDGGVMDNLPLDSVLTRMREMADGGEIALRPAAAPHLMVAASLEVDSAKKHGAELRRLEMYWPEMMSRAKELRYNIKLDNFETVARNIQTIFESTPGANPPLRINVLSIKPRWLTSTFAFHPMLGFRRTNQTRSIAHGCATTLLAFGAVREHCDSWGLNTAAVPKTDSLEDAASKLRKRDRKEFRQGHCWLRGVVCPFSSRALADFEEVELDKNTKQWVARIHRDCWKRSTHLPT